MFDLTTKMMQKSMERFEDIRLKQISSRSVGTPPRPIAAMPSDYDTWHNIYTPKTLAEITADFDQADKLATAASLQANAWNCSAGNISTICCRLPKTTPTRLLQCADCTSTYRMA